MNTHLLNRAILNRDALDDNQRKAMFARLGGHGGGTSYGGSASKSADAGTKDRMAKAWKMGFGLGLGMIGGLGIAGEAKAATPLAKSVATILRQARARLTGAPASGMVHPELNALNELSAGAKALKEAALREHGYVDEATSGALRTLRAEEEAIRMGTGNTVDKAWDLSVTRLGKLIGVSPEAAQQPGTRAALDRIMGKIGTKWYTPTGQRQAKEYAREAGLLRGASEPPAKYPPGVQAQRDELARQLRLDRERKRWDLHPETYFGNRGPISDQQRRAMFAKAGDPIRRINPPRLAPTTPTLPPVVRKLTPAPATPSAPAPKKPGRISLGGASSFTAWAAGGMKPHVLPTEMPDQVIRGLWKSVQGDPAAYQQAVAAYNKAFGYQGKKYIDPTTPMGRLFLDS